MSGSNKKIISTWVTSKHVVKSSSAMEPYAAKTLLVNLIEEFNLIPSSLTTDRSGIMKSMMRWRNIFLQKIDFSTNNFFREFNSELRILKGLEVRHLFDVWHYVKESFFTIHEILIPIFFLLLVSSKITMGRNKKEKLRKIDGLDGSYPKPYLALFQFQHW